MLQLLISLTRLSTSIMPREEAITFIDYLSNVPFFSEVSRLSLQKLCESAEQISYAKNEIVFNKDDSGDSMYVIIDGSVKIYDGNHLFGIMQKGDYFGEYALLDGKNRSASVSAIERTSALKIQRNSFLEAMETDYDFVKGVMSILVERHREIDLIQERLSSSKKALELANSKMEGLIKGAMDAIIMFDGNFKILLTNPSANKLLENDDVLQRNVLFFFGDDSANLIEGLVKGELNEKKPLNNYLPNVVKVIGSNESETLNEGTISKYGDGTDSFYTLILRNIEERLEAENQIDFLTKQTQCLKKEIQELTNDYGIIAEDKSMLSVLNLIDQVASTDATVLINGETGTGKELVARAIHKTSKRKDKPLLRINCGAIPTNLIESELFGHKKGAFTGATSDRKGRFLLADQGTIFLDEIGEMPIDLQPKLLRVIQEGEFEPVGSSETIKVDVRIIAATHRDLMLHSNEGKFREDLYYRLNVFPIVVPPLRLRGNDVLLITEEMIGQLSRKLNKPVLELSEADKSLLMSYSWPGNVRELQNLIERGIIVSQNGKVNWSAIIPKTSENNSSNLHEIEERIYNTSEWIELEKENIYKALKQTHWKISGKNGAAELLQIKPTTLASKIKALGIIRPV